LRKEIKAGKGVWGSLVWELPLPSTARALKNAGFDYCWIDTEHSPHSLETITTFLLTAREVGLPTLVRVADGDYHLIARVLDCGADGIIVPRVEKAETAQAVVAASRYPPEGRRGFGIHALLCPRTDLPLSERLARLNERTLVVVQIETKDGVDNLPAIATVPGIDVLFVGPADLSISYGVPGQFAHPCVTGLIDKLVALADNSSFAVGYHHDDVNLVRRAAAQGCTFMSVGNDLFWLEEGAKAALRQAKVHS
jgi:2-keto-3-deoxy-L-rhamnonate aldolase RhmA